MEEFSKLSEAKLFMPFLCTQEMKSVLFEKITGMGVFSPRTTM